jgi:murein L,D-transpeptidase YcbB/YkuD
VVAVAGFTSGLLNPDEPGRDTALQDGRTGAPEESGRTPASLSPSASASTEASAAKRASSSASTSTSTPASAMSAAPAAPLASTSRSASVTPAALNRVPAAPTADSVGSAQPPTSQTVTGPVLRRGDKGPEVAELQQRLRQLSFYTHDITGNFNIQVENAVRSYQSARGISAEPGVYDAATRRSLESETSEPD